MTTYNSIYSKTLDNGLELHVVHPQELHQQINNDGTIDVDLLVGVGDELHYAAKETILISELLNGIGSDTIVRFESHLDEM